MVPLHFLTPRFDLPVIPVNINCQGPPLTPLHARLGVRRGAAPRLRRGAGADRARRHRRHLALAGDARLGQDQRGLGPRVPRPLGAQRQARRCSPTATRRPTATPARAASRSAPSSPSPPRRAAAGELRFYAPIPIFSVGCTVATDGVNEIARSTAMPHVVDPVHRQPRSRGRRSARSAPALAEVICRAARRRRRAASSRSAARACSPIRRTHLRGRRRRARTAPSSTSTCASRRAASRRG